MTSKELEQNALDGHVNRGRRCENCKFWKTGEDLYQKLLKEGDWIPLEAFPTLRAMQIVAVEGEHGGMNPGMVDRVLKDVKEGKMGECPHVQDVREEHPRVVSRMFLCRQWSGIPGAKELFPASGDLLPEEIVQLRKESSEKV